MFGSDFDEKAIDQTETNLNWFEEEFGVEVSEVEVKVSDAKEIHKATEQTFDVVVTEPLLGPPQKGNESKKWINDQIESLTRLYSKSFASIARTMNPGARFVVTLPVFNHGGESHYLPIKKIIKGTKLHLVNMLPQSVGANSHSPLRKNKTPQGGILYARAGQHVGREIICLKLD